MVAVSIIIPTYNQAELLKECLDSVMSQTFQDFEILLINNASTDHTLDVALSYKNSQINILEYERRGAIGAVRNQGIHAAKGSLIAFLDSDDKWTPCKLEKIVTLFKNDPSIDIVCHDEFTLKANGLIGKKLRHGDAKNYDALLFGHNCISTSAVTIKTRCLKEVDGFDEDISFSGVEDYDLWLRLLKNGAKPYYLHECLGYYRIYQSSFSKNLERQSQHKINVLEKHFNVINPITEKIKRRIAYRKAISHRASANAFFILGEKQKAKLYCYTALSYYPYDIKTWAALLYILIKPKRKGSFA